MKTRVFLGLGSNLGDRMSHLRNAVGDLAQIVDVTRVSSVVETVAVGMPEDTPDFLNAVVEGRTEMGPSELLQECLALENEAGRVRGPEPESRSLDIDLLFYGDRIVRSPGLTIPHPRWRERSFVLRPLGEMAPGFRDPVTGKTMGEVWDERRSGLDAADVVLPADSTERWIGRRGRGTSDEIER